MAYRQNFFLMYCNVFRTALNRMKWTGNFDKLKNM